jgi:uncharacterized protein (TIGR02246 family)
MSLRTAWTLAAAFAWLSCMPAMAADDAADVKIVMDKFVRAWETNDISLIDAIVAKDKDAVWIGTDAAEFFVGYEPLRVSTAKQFGLYQGTKLTLKDLSIKLSASRSVAWVTAIVDVATRTGGENVSVPGTRLTVVLEKRQGSWAMVHMHWSVPVQGQAVKY